MSMIKFDNRVLRDATEIIDGSGERRLRVELQSYLKMHAPRGAITKVKLRDSVGEPLLQLSDMCVGAIARSYRSDRSGSLRWRQQITAKIEDIWGFQ